MNKRKISCKFLCVVLSALLCLAAAPVYTHAENTQTCDVVRVAVIDYPNFLNMGNTGVPSGYAYEYLEEVAKYTGWTYEFKEMTFSDAMAAIQNGEIDVLAGNQYTEERAKTMDFSSSSMGDGGSVLCIRTDDNRYCYNDYSAYDGIKIAALSGSARIEQTRQKLAAYGVTAEFVEYDTDDEAKAALENSEVDAVLMSNIRCEEKYKILARLDSIPIYFCTNMARPELKTELDQAMETIHLDNPYYEEQLNQKYYGSVAIQLAYTQDELTYIKNAGTINVAVSDDFAPIEYYNEKDSAFHGLVPDMLSLIAEKAGLNFNYVLRDTMEDTMAKVNSGDITMVASVADRPEVAEAWDVTLTDAYRTNSLSIVVNNNASTYQDPNCLVVLKAGYPYLEQAAANEGYSNFTYVDTFADCVKMVHDQEAAMSFIPSNSTDLTFTKYGYDDLIAYLLLNSNTDFSIGVSKKADPLLVSVLNKAIASISNEEKSALLIENLNSANETASFQHFLMTHRITILLVVIVLAVLIILGVLALAVTRKRTNLKLAAALREADSASHAKTDFLSRMSHDIRTPMNAIIGLTELAKEEAVSDTTKEYLSKIDSSSQFLLGLINDILDMSKIESGELTLNPEPYHIEQFSQIVLTMIKPLMDAKHITFVFEASGAHKCILVDRLRHNQIFFNLLSNACKFTPEGGKVEFLITSLPERNGLVGQNYCVRDNGIGMSDEFLQHLFEPFTQEHSTKNAGEVGTGLGLPIVKSLVDAMNGMITVKSELDKGTEFNIQLYYSPAEDVMDTSRQTVNYEVLKDAQILLAEDHPLNAEIAMKLLERVGCKVTWAKDGKECLDTFRNSSLHSFNLILMDMRMPVMDGLESTKEIRKLSREDAATVPVIAMTANAYTEDVEHCMAAGMNAHLAKPVEPARMYEVIATYLRDNHVD